MSFLSQATHQSKKQSIKSILKQQMRGDKKSSSVFDLDKMVQAREKQQEEHEKQQEQNFKKILEQEMRGGKKPGSVFNIDKMVQDHEKRQEEHEKQTQQDQKKDCSKIFSKK